MKTLEQIKAALDNDEFFMEYMPTIDLQSSRCVGAEALIRWQNFDDLISPAEFVSVIENMPLSGLLTYWIIEEIGRNLGDWLRENENTHIGINVPPDIIGRVGLEYAASKAGLTDVVDKLLLEVTERGIPDKQALAGMFGAKGKTRIALDDFGTGDANLIQLSQMPADVLKIDKYFIDQIKTEKDPPKIVRALTAFALAMEFELIAEGIELEVQVNVLRALGVHMGQGWYYSKPLKKDQFIDSYSKSTS